jgi:hypothetical protein
MHSEGHRSKQREQSYCNMQESPAKHNELFQLICRLLGEEESWRCRLVSSHEIVVHVLQSKEARAVIGLTRKHRPHESAEQWVRNLVDCLGQSATAVGSEWQDQVEALQITGEWFFRLRPQPVASDTTQPKKAPKGK